MPWLGRLHEDKKGQDKERELKADLTDTEKYRGEGFHFQGKLIGIDSVDKWRGNELCDTVMKKLNAELTLTKQHKRKIVIRVQWDEVVVLDDTCEEKLHVHPLGEISFVWKDSSDSRSFGMIVVRKELDTRAPVPKFYAYKTDKPVIALIECMKNLFALKANEKKRTASTDKANKTETNFPEVEKGIEVTEKDEEPSLPAQQAPPDITIGDLIDINSPPTESQLPGIFDVPSAAPAPIPASNDPWASCPTTTSSNATFDPWGSAPIDTPPSNPWPPTAAPIDTSSNSWPPTAPIDTPSNPWPPTASTNTPSKPWPPANVPFMFHPPNQPPPAIPPVTTSSQPWQTTPFSVNTGEFSSTARPPTSQIAWHADHIEPTVFSSSTGNNPPKQEGRTSPFIARTQDPGRPNTPSNYDDLFSDLIPSNAGLPKDRSYKNKSDMFADIRNVNKTSLAEMNHETPDSGPPKPPRGLRTDQIS